MKGLKKNLSAALRVLEPDISTAGPMGKVMLTVLGMVAEMELGFIKERQRAGIEKAKAAGVESVAFDRSGFRFHGRVKALADAAREAGLQF